MNITMLELVAGAVALLATGAGLFAAGEWFRHRATRPERPPVQPLPTENPWEMTK